MESLRIIIAGGGTGGHIFPAVAIGHAIRRMRPDAALLFVGAKNKMEMEKVPQEGFDIIGLDIAGFNRSHLLKNVSLPFKLLRSFMEARNIIKRFRPHAVVGVGGYASYPVLNAAQGMGIPTLIQEQNSFAGKSNKILGRKAISICVAYDKMERFFPKDKILMTGNPVRNNISRSDISREEGQAWLGLDGLKRTVLIIGGSLGARSINEAVSLHLEEMLEIGVRILWQTGKPYYEQAGRRAEGLEDVIVKEFIKEMDYAYAAADIVISRAGALAIAELCIAAKPVIFVPYPFAAEDHQTSNALALVEHNAALMVKDHECNTELIKKLRLLINDIPMQEIMRRNLELMAIKDADDRIAQQVFRIANEKMTA